MTRRAYSWWPAIDYATAVHFHHSSRTTVRCVLLAVGIAVTIAAALFFDLGKA